MFTPNFVNIVKFFYPIGNTPAVCLTQDLPREPAARILLLGCGDVRNILFTTYADEHRSFDITCCDIEVAILARNVLLLTLLVDDVNGSNSGAIWDIYYHLYLDEKSYQILQDQSQKLHALSESLGSWHQSRYGAFLRMCDESSLTRIRKAWDSFCTAHLNREQMKSYEKRFESRLQRAKDMKTARMGDGQVLTGFRSTAPISLPSLTDLPRLFQDFWDSGTTDGSDKPHRTALRPNPTFVASGKDTSTLHYGTDPVLGFHLATAYAPLTPDSPLHLGSCIVPSLRRIVEAAKVQFRAWGSTFRSRVSGNLILRFFAGDAISFCYALQHRKGTENDVSAHLYRDMSHSEPLLLNDKDYGERGGAPSTFNVIDTSNLLDHLGALNLLVASLPLLSDERAATLYTETLVKREESLKAMSDELLCGHFPTISILLGLFPVEYWANATAISTVDESMLNDVVGRTMGISKNHDGQMQCRFAWKRAPAQPTKSTGQTTMRLSFNALDLANILFRVYQKMLQHENMGLSLSRISLQHVKNSSYPLYHRGSLAMFLAFVKARVYVEWDTVMNKFLELVESDSSILMSRNYIQELYLYLHIFDVHSVPTLKEKPRIEGTLVGVGNMRQRENPSAFLCITLKVPRAVLKAFSEIPHTKLGTPLVHGILQSSRQFTGSPWQNIFSAVQLAFGHVVTSGSRHGNDLKLTIHEDEDGWMGESPLFVSFFVPSWITCLEPQTATIAFGIQSTPLSTVTFMKHYGLELNIYETYLGNTDNVYVTRAAPNQSGRPCVLHLAVLGKTALQAAGSPIDTLITPIVDESSAQITALAGRVDLKSKHTQDLLRAGARVETTQTSACVITIRMDTEIQYELCYPVPVIRSRSKLRLARKSSYIEVVAPIANPTGDEPLQHFMYPNFPDKQYPVNWNMPRLNLDRLPILDTTKTKDLQWLITHVSLMFSTRERILRETSTTTDDGLHSNVRLNYKESLFTMFMSFSGLQGTKSKIFGLSDRTRGGVAILIMGSRLRLDLANHTVVLDAAVLPLTTQLVPHIRPFLQAVTSMGMHVINVNEDEMRLWKQTISAYIERCRDWGHTSSCEYLTSSCIPITLETGKDFVCSCGKGRLSSYPMTGVPRWESISKHALRVALSPSFSIPYVESVCDGLDRKIQKKHIGMCDGCGKTQRSDGMALLKCSRCQNARYCSVECQRAQWRIHKQSCRSTTSQTRTTSAK